MSYIAPSSLLPGLEALNTTSWHTIRDSEFCFPDESSDRPYSHTSGSYTSIVSHCDIVPRRSSSHGSISHIDSYLVPTSSSGSVVSSSMDLVFMDSASESTEDSPCSDLELETTDYDSLDQGFMSDEAVALPLAERMHGFHHAQSSRRSSGSSNSSSQKNYGFRLDLTALTAAKPIAYVVPHSEAMVAPFGGVATSFQPAEAFSNKGASSTIQKSASVCVVSRPASSSAPTPVFRKRQAALHRRLLERPSIDSLVQHNILFGPDLSPSLSAAARAFKWRRNSDELNHLLARRASRDSLIQSNIIQLEATSKRQQRFKETQAALASTLGQRSSVTSLIQRNILYEPSSPHTASPSSSSTSPNSSSPPACQVSLSRTQH